MEQLWAPWRLAYVTVPKPAPTQEADPCFLCAGIAENQDRANLILRRTAKSVVLLNKYPYNNGHLLVAPLEHRGGLDELSAEQLLDLQLALQEMTKVLQNKIQPDGFNVGLNLGKAAGAGLPGHLHWHIVPRWNGDTNFMPIFADVKVIVQSLESLYDLLT